MQLQQRGFNNQFVQQQPQQQQQHQGAPPAYHQYHRFSPPAVHPMQVTAPPAATHVTPAQAAGFSGCHLGAPEVVALSGGWFRTHIKLRRADRSPWKSGSITEAVQTRHAQRLIDFQAALPATWDHVPLVECLREFFHAENAMRQWQPASLWREVTQMTGAFSKLPEYSNYPHPVHLRKDPAWAALMSTIEQESHQAQPHHLAAVDCEQLVAATELEKDPETRMALIIMWSTASRPGCVLQLKRQDLELEPQPFRPRPGAELRITFRQGKGVSFRGPYTVQTWVPDRWARELQQFISPLQKTDHLFPFSKTDRDARHARLLAAVRRVDPKLNLRAMRRGALQAMAQKGHDAATLMQFSGHKSQDTLMRYLDQGRTYRHDQAIATGAAQALYPPQL
jgi:integrase